MHKLTPPQQKILDEIDSGKVLKFSWHSRSYIYSTTQFTFQGPSKTAVESLMKKGYLKLEPCAIGESVANITRLFPEEK